MASYRDLQRRSPHDQPHPSLLMDPTSSVRECSLFASFLVCISMWLIHCLSEFDSGRGLFLTPGVQVPEVIQRALESAPSNNVPRKSTSNRDSVQRKRYWWFPYVVLEFDKNEILIDALGGDLSNPVWNYRADLCAPSVIVKFPFF
jgi:hypothetical protein